MSHFQIRTPQAEKAAALRKLAERTTYPEERDTALALANRLMYKHELSEEDLAEYDISPAIRFLFGER